MKSAKYVRFLTHIYIKIDDFYDKTTLELSLVSINFIEAPQIRAIGANEQKAGHIE